MKFLKVLVIVLLIAANGVILFFATTGGEGVPPIGSLKHPGSYPEFGTEAITFAPTATHSWPGAIEGGINGDASVIEKAVYLFLLACYNERDLPYYAYFLPGGGGTDMGNLKGTMLAHSYKVVNNTIGDNELSYYRLFNYVVDGSPEGLLGPIRMVLNDAYQRVELNDTRYRIDAPKTHISIVSEADEDVVLGAAWNYATLKSSEYDGLVDKWEDMDITGMTQDEIDFIYRYESRITIDLLVPGMVESATLEYITTGEHAYWEGSIVVDIDVANNDPKTVAKLLSATSNLGKSFNKFELTFQIWDVGVFKYWSAEESWNGEIIGLSGFSFSEAPCYYSYNLEDCDLTELFAEFNLEVPTA